MYVIYIKVNIWRYLHPYKSANMSSEDVIVDVKVVGEGLGGAGDTSGSVDDEVKTPDSGYSSVSSHSSRLSSLY